MNRHLPRYKASFRLNHWAVAMLFVAAGLTGLVIFHPFFFPLSALFGGGTWTRILHPYMGLLMVFGFVFLFIASWRANLWKKRDTEWVKAAPHLIRTGDEARMPEVAKYNAGQKGVFWIFAVSLVLLFFTGFVFWQPWFADFFSVPMRRVAVVVHAAAAAVLILSVIMHVYAGIWIKGSIHAMMRGTVSEAWARKHHLLWYREITGKQ